LCLTRLHRQFIRGNRRALLSCPTVPESDVGNRVEMERSTTSRQAVSHPRQPPVPVLELTLRVDITPRYRILSLPSWGWGASRYSLPLCLGSPGRGGKRSSRLNSSSGGSPLRRKSLLPHLSEGRRCIWWLGAAISATRNRFLFPSYTQGFSLFYIFKKHGSDFGKERSKNEAAGG
jgi:hypothetical protein